ncbi:cysteine hydrolase family protein [Xylariaceae sp. FL1019]|nr:cysteine hydrolase family protein [Xylariaceae sp. FL1019]
MRFSSFIISCASVIGSARVEAGACGNDSSNAVGYVPVDSTIPEGTAFDFGSNYAVINFDLINGIVAGVENTAEGQTWINSTARWIDAVHAKTESPLQIFTSLYFQNGHPETPDNSPFGLLIGALINNTATSDASQIYSAFTVDTEGYANGTSRDVLIQKTRFDASYASQLLQILAAQNIDTVVISGIKTSGVILSTVYTLFDLDYHIYVISNNTIQSPTDEQANAPAIDLAIKGGILPNLSVDVINIDQALAALAASG